MSLEKEKAYDEDATSNANGHDPSVCGVCSSTRSDALNDELHERLEEIVLERHGTSMDSYCCGKN